MVRRWKSAAARRIRSLADAATTEDAVEVIAEQLLEGMNAPPTDLEQLASRLNVVELKADPEFIGAGCLERAESGFRVIYSSLQPPARQRFTIAHELGHAVLEHSGATLPAARHRA